MDIDLLKKAGIDYEDGLARMMGNAGAYECILAMFLSDTSYSRAQQAYSAGDAESLFSAVHEMKGVSGSIGMKTLYQASDALVAVLRQQEHSKSELDEGFSRFEQEYRISRDAVMAALNA